MKLKTVYYNFDDCVVTWYHPTQVDWQKVTDTSLHSVYNGLAPDLPGPCWVVHIRHVGLRSARWCLVVGTNPDYAGTVRILRKELAVGIV